MFRRYKTNVTQAYSVDDNGNIVPCSRTVFRKDRFERLSCLWEFCCGYVFPAIAISVVGGVILHLFLYVVSMILG